MFWTFTIHRCERHEALSKLRWPEWIFSCYPRYSWASLANIVVQHDTNSSPNYSHQCYKTCPSIEGTLSIPCGWKPYPCYVYYWSRVTAQPKMIQRKVMFQANCSEKEKRKKGKKNKQCGKGKITWSDVVRWLKTFGYVPKDSMRAWLQKLHCPSPISNCCWSHKTWRKSSAT